MDHDHGNDRTPATRCAIGIKPVAALRLILASVIFLVGDKVAYLGFWSLAFAGALPTWLCGS